MIDVWIWNEWIIIILLFWDSPTSSRDILFWTELYHLMIFMKSSQWEVYILLLMSVVLMEKVN